MRTEERKTVLGAFFALFGMTASHSLLETARDALFLAAFPITRLVWAYLAITVLTVVVVRARERRGAARIARLMPGLLLGAAVTLGLWAATPLGSTSVLYALYLWPGIYAVWTVGTLWSLIGTTFTVSQAKRLFGFIGAGGVLGALVGAVLSRVLAGAFAPQHLLPAAAALLLATGVGPGRALGRISAAPSPRSHASPQEDASRSFRSDLQAFRGDPYAKRVLALVFFATMTLTTTDFLFKSSVAAHVPTKDLGSFLATVSIAVNALALVAQLVAVRLILRVFGVHRALCVMPLLLILGGAGVVAAPMLFAAVILRGTDGSLRHSLHKTTSELLFVPLSQATRARIQPLIDLLGQRGGQVIASLALLPIFVHCGERALGAAILARSSPRSTARRTAKCLARWICWQRRIDSDSSPRSFSITRRSSSFCGR